MKVPNPVTFRNKHGRFRIEFTSDYYTIKPHESMGYPDYLQEGRTHRIWRKTVEAYMNNLTKFFEVYYGKDKTNETK